MIIEIEPVSKRMRIRVIKVEMITWTIEHIPVSSGDSECVDSNANSIYQSSKGDASKCRVSISSSSTISTDANNMFGLCNEIATNQATKSRGAIAIYESFTNFDLNYFLFLNQTCSRVSRKQATLFSSKTERKK